MCFLRARRELPRAGTRRVFTYSLQVSKVQRGMLAPSVARGMQGGVNFRDLGTAASFLRKGAIFRCSQVFT